MLAAALFSVQYLCRNGRAARLVCYNECAARCCCLLPTIAAWLASVTNTEARAKCCLSSCPATCGCRYGHSWPPPTWFVASRPVRACGLRPYSRSVCGVPAIGGILGWRCAFRVVALLCCWVAAYRPPTACAACQNDTAASRTAYFEEARRRLRVSHDSRAINKVRVKLWPWCIPVLPAMIKSSSCVFPIGFHAGSVSDDA